MDFLFANVSLKVFTELIYFFSDLEPEYYLFNHQMHSIHHMQNLPKPNTVWINNDFLILENWSRFHKSSTIIISNPANMGCKPKNKYDHKAFGAIVLQKQ
jgi:hypothetical protein